MSKDPDIDIRVYREGDELDIIIAGTGFPWLAENIYKCKQPSLLALEISLSASIQERNWSCRGSG